MNKYKIYYEAQPISEVVKIAYVTAYDVEEAVQFFRADTPNHGEIFKVELVDE